MEVLTWIVLAILVLGLDAYAITRALLRHHDVEGTIAWILVILVAPVAGAGAYLLLASPRLRRRTLRKRRALVAAREREGAARRAGVVPPACGPEAKSGTILHLAAAATGFEASPGNEVQLLAENDHAFAMIENAVKAAERSIWAEFYIIANDVTARRFLEILATKAAEGVDVRLLYDAFGSLGIDGELLGAISARRGKTRAFLPLNPLRRGWNHLRNHRKIVVVDGKVGFTGGMNIGDQYSGRPSSARKRVEAEAQAGDVFRDSQLALRGPSVTSLAEIFAEDWMFAAGEELALPEPCAPVAQATSTVAIVPSGPDQEHNANALVYFAGIVAAHERVYVTTPYFVPDVATQRALVTAALRGVDVRLLVPSRSDVPIVSAAARAYYPPLLRAGVRIFEYLPAVLHAKTMVIDGRWGFVGSANVDVRSFSFNFEVGALVEDPGFAAKLEEKFLEDLARSEEITTETVARYGSWKRLKHAAARLLSPIL